MISQSLRARTYLFIAFIVTLNPLGNTFLREGMNRAGAPSHWTFQALALFFWKAFQSGAVWLGISASDSVFHLLHVGAFLGRLQLRSACLRRQLCCRGTLRVRGSG